MTTYARLTEDAQSVRDVIELTDEQYTVLDGNPKQALLRPLVVDERPTPTETQIIRRGPYEIEPTQVRQTWLLVEKSAEQLAEEAAEAERRTDYQQLRDVLVALRDGTGTQAERLRRVERVCARLLRDALRGAGL